MDQESSAIVPYRKEDEVIDLEHNQQTGQGTSKKYQESDLEKPLISSCEAVETMVTIYESHKNKKWVSYCSFFMLLRCVYQNFLYTYYKKQEFFVYLL